MIDPTGRWSPAISLPQGGGAVKGIVETFVPIPSSPGRDGFGLHFATECSTDE